MQDYSTYYASIEKPFFAPEPWVFGLAWSIIYPLIIIALLLTLYRWWQGRVSQIVLAVFGINVLANLAFTPLQLNFPEAPYATIDILVVLGTLVYLQWYFWQHDRVVFWLLVPYLLWGAFATVLQVTIFILNFV
jgi:tryptophan-rich sensory protein